MTQRKQIVLLLCALFVAGIGFGVTLPVLPFFAERLMGTQGSGKDGMTLHVTGLTGVYALVQFIFAPMWGSWSDRAGRKRMIWIGIVGTAVSQLLFGLATSLPLLYGARVLGGFLSASLIPVATAYIADLSTDDNRSAHMAWLGTVSSLSTVAGLALGGVVSATDLHFRAEYWHFRVDAFSVPFLVAALFMLVAAVVVWRWLPEPEPQLKPAVRQPSGSWGGLIVSMARLLVLALSGQIALTAFEATFPLFAQWKFGYGPTQVGTVFIVCGLVMAVFQVVAVGYAAQRLRITAQLGLGFGLMGVGILLLIFARSFAGILWEVGALALGMAFIAPNLSALSALGRNERTGAAVGLLSGANNLGQAVGPMIGGALYAWRAEAPYVASGITMFVIALLVLLGRDHLVPSLSESRVPANQGV